MLIVCVCVCKVCVLRTRVQCVEHKFIRRCRTHERRIRREKKKSHIHKNFTKRILYFFSCRCQKTTTQRDTHSPPLTVWNCEIFFSPPPLSPMGRNDVRKINGICAPRLHIFIYVAITSKLRRVRDPRRAVWVGVHFRAIGWMCCAARNDMNGTRTARNRWIKIYEFFFFSARVFFPFFVFCFFFFFSLWFRDHCFRL